MITNGTLRFLVFFPLVAGFLVVGLIYFGK